MRAGHRIGVSHNTASHPDRSLDRILGFERSRAAGSLARRDAPPVEANAGVPDLVLDFTGRAEGRGVPSLTLEFNGQHDLPTGLASLLEHEMDANLLARLDGVAVAEARPMLGDRVWLGRAASDLLASAVTLVEMCLTRFALGTLRSIGPRARATIAPGRLGALYARHLPVALGQRVWRKLTRRRPFYWRTAYRFIDGPGIADTGRLGGSAFTELPDDGQRFYADPFAFEWQGKPYLFVEEYPYATGRGIISVAELGADGRFGTPQPVIVEGHHLSYPQVFAQAGEIYMIPEASAARELVLYRATEFPLKWERAAVLARGPRLNDMTLVERAGRFWLIGTEQIGAGSASDTMVAWSAPAITGPWAPHKLGPIRIDHSAARPGGRFIARGKRLLLPLQDGSASYGGGLGLAELLALDENEVRFGRVEPIGGGEAWPGHAVHTLTRAGRLEAVDSASVQPGGRGQPAAKPSRPAAARGAVRLGT